MGDMRQVIISKSDQINADDLLSGPLTIRIAGVSIQPGAEQPVSVSYEGDNGKPWKPCKSMARVLVSIWGADSSKYVGRSLTLYCDPKVKWGGMEVGGIRISHMSDIDKTITLALTVTRANKKPFVVRPIATGGAKTSPAIPPPHPTADSAASATDSSSGDYLSDDQVAKVKEALEMTGIAVDRLLAKVGAQFISNIPAEHFKRAMDWINKAADQKAVA